MKICRKCAEKKEFSEFSRLSSSKDGLNSCCKKCLYSYNKTKRNLILCDSCKTRYHAINASLCRKCYYGTIKREGHPGWKGGRSIQKGYVYLSGYEGHPSANGSGNVREHTIVMEQMIGRRLLKGESVHHKNGNRSDNRPANLELWSKFQPAGQRVEDKLEWALEILLTYAPERLA